MTVVYMNVYMMHADIRVAATLHMAALTLPNSGET